MINRPSHADTEDAADLCLLKMLPVIIHEADCIQHSMTQLLLVAVDLSALCSPLVSLTVLIDCFSVIVNYPHTHADWSEHQWCTYLFVH